MTERKSFKIFTLKMHITATGVSSPELQMKVFLLRNDTFATPYLLQNVDGVPAALQPGGEAGCGRGVVILCRFREELGHRDLIRHPCAG